MILEYIVWYNVSNKYLSCISSLRGISLQEIGLMLENLGYKIMPLSFIAYFIVRLLEYKWGNKKISKLGKSIWYIAIGIGSLDGDIRVEQLVTMMVFFDALDSFLEYKEENKL